MPRAIRTVGVHHPATHARDRHPKNLGGFNDADHFPVLQEHSQSDCGRIGVGVSGVLLRHHPVARRLRVQDEHQSLRVRAGGRDRHRHRVFYDRVTVLPNRQLESDQRVALRVTGSDLTPNGSSSVR